MESFYAKEGKKVISKRKGLVWARSPSFWEEGNSLVYHAYYLISSCSGNFRLFYRSCFWAGLKLGLTRWSVHDSVWGLLSLFNTVLLRCPTHQGIRETVQLRLEPELTGQDLNQSEARLGLKSMVFNWGHTPGLSVLPDVQIPEREERGLPRQCNLQKREVYYWLEPGLLLQPTQWCRVREPGAQAVTQIYRVCISGW